MDDNLKMYRTGDGTHFVPVPPGIVLYPGRPGGQPVPVVGYAMRRQSMNDVMQAVVAGLDGYLYWCPDVGADVRTAPQSPWGDLDV